MTRDEQKEKRYQEILCAGLELFIKKGYAATKVADIAKQAGMSAGLMFHYFESKEQLYIELVKLGLSGPKAVMAGAGGEPLAFFETAAKEVIAYISEDPFVAKMFVLITQAMYSEGIPASAKVMMEGFGAVADSAEIIRAGQAAGTIRQGDPLALSMAFWGAINGVAEQIAKSPEMPAPEPQWIVDIIRKKEEL